MFRAVVWGAAILAAAFGYFIYPYATLHRIERAFAERDVPKLEALIDWQKVRAGLKADVSELVNTTSMQKLDKQDNGAGVLGFQLGMLLGGAIVDRAIDAVVTPSSLLRLLAERREKTSCITLQDCIVGAGFASPTVFHAMIRAPDSPVAEPLILVLELSGLEWKATRLLIPMDAARKALESKDAESAILEQLKQKRK